MTRYIAPLSFHVFFRRLVAQSDAFQRPLSKLQSIYHHPNSSDFCNFLTKLTPFKILFKLHKKYFSSKCFLISKFQRFFSCMKSREPIKCEAHFPRSLIGLKSWPFQPGRGQPAWRARAGVFDSARVSSILSFTWNLRVASVARNPVKSLCFKQS